MLDHVHISGLTGFSSARNLTFSLFFGLETLPSVICFSRLTFLIVATFAFFGLPIFMTYKTKLL